MSNTWWTSDTHFGHRNIIRYCDRPYSSVEEMDEAIIKEWNNKVGPEDIVYHLGDFSFYRKVDVAISLLERLNGDIFFIKGNHDSDQFLKKAMMSSSVLGVKDIHSVKIDDPDAPHGKQRIVMCHYAMEIWDRAHYGAWHLFGHSHGTLPDNLDKMRLDVGLDNHDMKILSYEDIKIAMFRRGYKAIDHHNPKEQR